jgi:hypothetical protein
MYEANPSSIFLIHSDKKKAFLLLSNSIKTLRATMPVHTIHVYDVKEENRTETKFFRANGIFLNLP